MKIRYAAISIIMLFIISCNSNEKKVEENNGTTSVATPAINYSVISIFQHDTSSFTEGFLIHDGKLYESPGYTDEIPQTRSLFGEVDLKTGKIDPKVELDKEKYFGEGISFLNDKVYQLTYETKIGFIYDAKTFKKTGDFSFPSKEGWGMTTDTVDLIMSDGTNMLTYLDPLTLKPVKALSVTDEDGPVINLNELEYIKGYIYANIYTTNSIVKIDPVSGKVMGRLDLTSLEDEQRKKFDGALEMNGIAYDPSTGKVYITGKLWPNIYEIKFDH